MEKQIKKYEDDIKEFEMREQSAISKSQSFSGYDDVHLLSYEDSIGYKSGNDTNYDINQDLQNINKWIDDKTGDKAKDRKNFNKKMIDLLTKRTDEYRLELVKLYKDINGVELYKEIARKLDNKTNGIQYIYFM